MISHPTESNLQSEGIVLIHTAQRRKTSLDVLVASGFYVSFSTLLRGWFCLVANKRQELKIIIYYSVEKESSIISGPFEIMALHDCKQTVICEW